MQKLFQLSKLVSTLLLLNFSACKKEENSNNPSSTPSWTVYNTSNSGIRTNNIEAIAVDDNGNVWFGTYDGLGKYDGTNWIWYDTLNSELPDNFVTDIAIGNNNVIWITTPPYLVRFDGNTWNSYNSYGVFGIGGPLWSVKATKSRNQVLLAGYDGVAAFDGSNLILYKYFSDAYSMIEDNLGNYWVGYRDGLAKYNGIGWNDYTSSPSDFWVWAITSTPNNTIWAGGQTGPVSYNGSIWTDHQYYEIGWVEDILAIGNNEIWFAGSGGLAKYNGQSWIKYDTSNSPITSRAPSIDVDNDGNLWIATFDNGIIKMVNP